MDFYVEKDFDKVICNYVTSHSHAVPSCKVSVHKLASCQVLHAMGYVQTHPQENPLTKALK